MRASARVLQELLLSRTGRLALYFENELERLVGRSRNLAAVLDKLAEGPMRLVDLSDLEKLRDLPALLDCSAFLQRL